MILNEQNFEQEVLKLQGVALVDFFATWCGPCQVLGPIVEELAAELNSDTVKIAKIDVDQNPNLSEKYEIMSVPTLILFKNGEVKEVLHGIQNKSMLKELIENNK